MEQRSEAWFDARKGKITGSRIGAILGHNPFQTYDDVMRDMVREYLGAESEFTGNKATEHGQQMEPYAVAWYEANHKVTVDATGFVVHPDPEYDYLGASPDGLVGQDGAIEVKCPFYTRVPYSVFDPKKRMYYDQCQHVMEVCDLDWLDFVCYINDDIVRVDRVMRDRKWFKKHRHLLEQFIAEFRRTVADPKLAQKHLKPRDSAPDRASYQHISDPRMARMHALQMQADFFRRELKELEEELGPLKREMFDEYGFCTDGKVRLVCIERKGAVDYKRLLTEMKVNELLAAAHKTEDDFRKVGTLAYALEILEDDDK